MIELICILLTISFVASLFVYKKHGRQLQLSTKMPGPSAYPIIGNGLDLLNKSPIEFVGILARYINTYGTFWRLWLGNQLIVYIGDPKDCEVVFTSSKLITKSDEYNFIKPWLGEGLLISRGRKWTSHRKIITPAFHFKILDQFVEVFNKESSVLVKKLATFKNKGSFDVFPHVCLCALDVICETSMGVEMNSQNEDNTEYVHAVKEISELIHKRSFDFIQRYDILFQFTPTAQKQKSLLKILHGFSERVIVDRRKKLIEENNNNVVNINDVGEKKKMALLDVLLQSNVDGKPLTNLEIRQEVDTFMFEGHDTTTSGLAFGLYNIAKYPEVQKKIMQEIREVIGDDPNENVTMKQLNDLNYLELVIKESLRLFPSVPLFGRKAIEEFEMNGKTIPAGANLIIGAFFMGRDPNLFHEPEKFIPERYDVEKSADKTNPYAYVPFSAGQRNCIGQKFALLELKSTLSKVLRHYEISIPENYEPIPVLELIVKSANGVLLQIKDRVYE